MVAGCIGRKGGGEAEKEDKGGSKPSLTGVKIEK
jgi:hypothetical protein